MPEFIAYPLALLIINSELVVPFILAGLIIFAVRDIWK